MANAQPRIALRIGDTDWLGWLHANVMMTMDAVSGSFTVGLTDRWPGSGSSRPISPFMPCRLLLDDEPLITGYIDRVSPNGSHDDHTVTITGRDKTSDLVDCAAVTGEWRGLKLDAIIAELAKPVGISVKAEVDVGVPFERFRTQEGEQAWPAIDRACKARAVVAMADGNGNVLLTRAKMSSGSPAPLILGGKDGNVLSFSGDFSGEERFSVYTIKAQQGGLAGTPEDRAHVIAEARDDGVPRYRPMTIIARDRMDAAAARRQAQWECNVRRGQALRATYTLAGWRTAAGKIWRPNTIVRVRDDWQWMAIDRDLIVVSVRLEVSGDGMLTTLDLTDPSAYLPEPPPQEKKKGGKGKPKVEDVGL